ncbi:MAG: B12-binding domain-containing protein [Phycisphaerae bacterium]
MSDPLLMRYMQPLLGGRRAECFELMTDAVHAGRRADDLVMHVVWPAMAQIDRLFRDDAINHAAHNMACRINRTVANQLQARLPRSARNGKRVLLTCADCPNEETGAQMIADLFQADGWEVFFMGSGVPHDEIVAIVGQLRPNVLMIFGTEPTAVPATRQLVEWIREVNACPTMNIIVSGGVYNRADGLWQEILVDAFAPTAREVLQVANELKPREATTTRRTGTVKKRHRRRKTTMSATPPVALAV